VGFSVRRAWSEQLYSGRTGWMKNRTLTVLLHNGEHLDNDLGARADKHLTLSATLGVDNVVLKG
jgi:hypothetical protein